MYDEMIVAQLQEKGYEYSQQIIDDFLEGRLLFDDNAMLHKYLHSLQMAENSKPRKNDNPVQVRNTLKN